MALGLAPALAAGLGYINELKVGSMGMSAASRTRESNGDHQLIKQGPRDRRQYGD